MLDKVYIHQHLNSGKIINKYYFKEGVIAEHESFDSYFNETSEHQEFIKVKMSKYLNDLDLAITTDKDSSLRKTNDNELEVALDYYNIDYRKDKSTCIFLIKQESYFSLNQLKNVNAEDVKKMIYYIKSNINLIKNTREPEKIIHKISKVGKLSHNSMLIMSDDKTEFLIPNLVLYSIIKLMYKIDIMEILPEKLEDNEQL